MIFDAECVLRSVRLEAVSVESFSSAFSLSKQPPPLRVGEFEEENEKDAGKGLPQAGSQPETPQQYCGRWKGQSPVCRRQQSRDRNVFAAQADWGQFHVSGLNCCGRHSTEVFLAWISGNNLDL